jgi:putative oxidoreductase
MLPTKSPTAFSVKNYWKQLPDLSFSHILLRIPLSLLFISQGLTKLPFDPAVGHAMGLPALVWWFVCYGEIASGLGLLAGGLTTIPKIKDIALLAVFGDLITRFSGIVMCCIVTGIIWTVLKPESLLTFILTDYMHFSLWAGGLYFGLRGNWAVAVNKKA